MKWLLPAAVLYAVMAVMFASCNSGDPSVFNEPIIQQQAETTTEDYSEENDDSAGTPQTELHCYSMRYRQGLVWYTHEFQSESKVDYSQAQRKVEQYAGWYHDTARLDEVMCPED